MKQPTAAPVTDAAVFYEKEVSYDRHHTPPCS